MMMMSARNRSFFTPSQWQELENQALIFKYLVSGIPIPPDLIFTIRRSLDSSITSRTFPHQPNGWGCFQVGFGRKADPEPGRCRRTDGKKWRCSKEAFQDSKYCERHMHRGRNRSRKPVEVTETTNPSTSIISVIRNPSSTITTDLNTSSYSVSSLSSSMAAASDTHQPHHNHHQHHPYYNNTPFHPFLYPPQSSSLGNRDYRRNRYFQGLEELDERAFFSESSGTVRNLPGSSLDDPWQLTPLRMSSSLADQSKQLQLQSFTDDSSKQEEEQHCFVLGTDFKREERNVMKVEREEEEEPQKHLRHFFDEWPLKNRGDSWLDLDEDRSSSASFSTTQLSISTPIPHSRRTQKGI